MLFVPTPRRLFDIDGMLEDFAANLETKCLRWSRITFGDKEKRLQELLCFGILKRDDFEENTEEAGFARHEMETCLG